ncbi:MAG: hypothetical protein KatS3mg113_0050 [Planctomycetaceae bacterium]|nr:MAG: hypothetical protein KatS3mg113_0050 [Planctomycetaceae bacterium]
MGFWVVAHRELLDVFRQRRTPLMLLGLATGLVLLLAIRWPTDRYLALSGTRSRELFRLLTFGQLAGLLLMLPVFPATTLVRERQRGTLALLLNTPLGAGHILLGKWVAMLLLTGCVLSVMLPTLVACALLGGIRWGADLGMFYVILLLTSLVIISLGLWVSSLAHTLDGAVRWTYTWVLVFSLFSMLPHYFLVGQGGTLASVVQALRSASPVAVLAQLLGVGDLGSRGLTWTQPMMQRFILWSLGITAAGVITVHSRLNYRLFDQARPIGTIADELGLGWRLARRMVFLVDPARRSRAISRWVNPVMVKEFRCRRFGRLHWLLRLVSLCGVLSLALAILTTTRTVEWDVATIGATLVVLQVALLVLITPSLSAGLISGEIESGGWLLLQTTPLSPWQIVWGKLLSVLLTMALILCATLPGYVVMVYIEPGLKLEVQRVVLTLVWTALLTMSISTAVGSQFHAVAPATALAYSVMLALCGLPMLVWLGRDAPFGHAVVERALMINPLAAAFSIIRLPGFRDYNLVPGFWWFAGIVCAASIFLLVRKTRQLTLPQ